METSRERVLKAINHIQPDVTPVHIIGFEGVERWLKYFQVKDTFELRAMLGLDIRMAPPIYVGPNASLDLSIWGRRKTSPTTKGSATAGRRETTLLLKQSL